MVSGIGGVCPKLVTKSANKRQSISVNGKDERLAWAVGILPQACWGALLSHLRPYIWSACTGPTYFFYFSLGPFFAMDDHRTTWSFPSLWIHGNFSWSPTHKCLDIISMVIFTERGVHFPRVCHFFLSNYLSARSTCPGGNAEVKQSPPSINH